MPIRTLRDLENANGQPSQQGQQGRYVSYAGGAQGSYMPAPSQQPTPQMMMHDEFWSPNLPPDQPPSSKDYCCMCCCGPCCVGDPCSQARKGDYKRALKMFIGVVSIIQVVYFIVSLCIDGFDPSVQNPSIGPPACVLDMLGAKDPYRMRYNFQVFRFITPVFLHAGLFHILFNVFIVQIRTGLIIEVHWGWKRISVVYGLSGVGATLLSCLLSPNGLSVGASGAILGLFGARLSEIYAKWDHPESAELLLPGMMSRRTQELINLMVVVLICFMLGTSPYVDSAAHLGGLVTGLLLGLHMFSEYFPTETKRKVWKVIGTFGLASFFIVGFSVFYSVTQPLPICG